MTLNRLRYIPENDEVSKILTIEKTKQELNSRTIKEQLLNQNVI